jgi:hypothetical protein
VTATLPSHVIIALQRDSAKLYAICNAMQVSMRHQGAVLSVH